jgi:hypothetical protein
MVLEFGACEQWCILSALATTGGEIRGHPGASTKVHVSA